jgi:hypothetical protein
VTFTPSSDFPDATDEQVWDQFRLWRAQELAATDFTQLPDAPVDAAVWAVYRQALRHAPQQHTDPRALSLPDRPAH